MIFNEQPWLFSSHFMTPCQHFSHFARSFKPILRLLVPESSVSPEAQYWAVWALCNLTTMYRKYHHVLVNASSVLKWSLFIAAASFISLSLCPSVCPCVCHSFFFTISYHRMFMKLALDIHLMKCLRHVQKFKGQGHMDCSNFLLCLLRGSNVTNLLNIRHEYNP